MAGEVVLCGGAINSPQLLQLSGVGNADELGALGIDVVHDLPGVGEHLQDHLEVYIQYACKQPVSVAPYMKWRWRPWVGLQWLFLRSGPGATNHFEAGGFVRSNDDVAYPNLMFHFLPIAVRYDGSAPASDHGYQVHIGPMYSDARGSVKITSRDPSVHPALRFNYLSTEQDRREWVEAIRVARRHPEPAGVRPVQRRRALAGPERRDRRGDPGVGREGRRDRAASVVHVRAWAPTTCPWSIPITMRVHGLQGLRVVDASVMPYVTNGNIYAPVMMVAEKAADLILGNTPLPPEKVEFYRHGVGRMRSPSTFHHVTLSVTDLPRSVDWYERVLGMSKVADREGPDLDPRADAIRGRARDQPDGARGHPAATASTNGASGSTTSRSRARTAPRWRRGSDTSTELGVEHGDAGRRGLRPRADLPRPRRHPGRVLRAGRAVVRRGLAAEPQHQQPDDHERDPRDTGSAPVARAGSAATARRRRAGTPRSRRA